jgi:hypothetical protein
VPIVGAYCSRSVVVGAKSVKDNESSDTSEGDDMDNLFIEEDDEEYNEDETIKKWCNKQIDGITREFNLKMNWRHETVTNQWCPLATKSIKNGSVVMTPKKKKTRGVSDIP